MPQLCLSQQLEAGMHGTRYPPDPCPQAAQQRLGPAVVQEGGLQGRQQAPTDLQHHHTAQSHKPHQGTGSFSPPCREPQQMGFRGQQVAEVTLVTQQ
jgi:hypothetical protein